MTDNPFSIRPDRVPFHGRPPALVTVACVNGVTTAPKVGLRPNRNSIKEK